MQHNGKQNILDDFTKFIKNKRYVPSSIRSYKNAISLFLDAFPNKNPENISIREIEEFLKASFKQIVPIDVSNFDSGLYLIVFKSGNFKYTKKFIKK